MENNKCFNRELIRSLGIAQIMLAYIWATVGIISAFITLWYSSQLNADLCIQYEVIIAISLIIVILIVLFQNFLPCYWLREQLKGHKYNCSLIDYLELDDYAKSCCLQNAIYACIYGVFMVCVGQLFVYSQLPISIMYAIIVLLFVLILLSAFMLIVTAWEIQDSRLKQNPIR